MALAQVGYRGFLVAFGLSAVGVALRFFRWRMYLAILGCRVPFSQSLIVFFAGFALAATPGSAGLAVRSVFLKRLGVGYPESLAVFLSERFTDCLGLVAIAAFAMSAFPVVSRLMPFILLPLVVVTYLLARRSLFQKLQHRFSCRQGLLARFLTAMSKAAVDAGVCMQFRVALIGILLGISSTLMNALALFYLLANIGLEVEPLNVIFAYAAGVVAGVASLTPAGIGATEAVIALLLVNFGLPEAATVAAVLAVRVTSLWAWVVIGLIAWAYFGWRWHALGEQCAESESGYGKQGGRCPPRA